jgi:hypothetical protein
VKVRRVEYGRYFPYGDDIENVIKIYYELIWGIIFKIAYDEYW